MNEDKPEENVPDVDRQVSDQYRAHAAETAPARLDRAVLREAKRAVRADKRKTSAGAWFRPVAFAATVGLALAIVIDLGKLGIVGPPDTTAGTAETVPAAPRAERPPEMAAPGQTTLNEIKRQEKSGATGSAAAGRDTGETAQGGLTKLEAAPAHSKTAAESETDAGTVTGCSAEQKATPDGWWTCIVSLKESGRNETADRELGRLRESFPEFALPE